MLPSIGICWLSSTRLSYLTSLNCESFLSSRLSMKPNQQSFPHRDAIPRAAFPWIDTGIFLAPVLSLCLWRVNWLVEWTVATTTGILRQACIDGFSCCSSGLPVKHAYCALRPDFSPIPYHQVDVSTISVQIWRNRNCRWAQDGNLVAFYIQVAYNSYKHTWSIPRIHWLYWPTLCYKCKYLVLYIVDHKNG
jgi:hypothetical protein